MKIRLQFALMLCLIVPFASAQTADQKVCAAAKGSSLQCAPAQTEASVPKQTSMPAPAAPLPPTAIAESKRMEFPFLQRHSVTIPAQVNLVAFRVERDEPRASTYTAGNSLGNQIGGAFARSVQTSRFRSYVRKTCRRYGSGTGWVWLFPNGQTVEGTCN